MNPQPIHRTTGQTAAQWLAALSDYLPPAFVFAHGAQFCELFNLGATVGEASTFARAYLRAPRVECEDLTPEEARPFAMVRAVSDVEQMARALRAREDRDL